MGHRATCDHGSQFVGVENAAPQLYAVQGTDHGLGVAKITAAWVLLLAENDRSIGLDSRADGEAGARIAQLTVSVDTPSTVYRLPRHADVMPTKKTKFNMR